jgi:hypothetical protein
MAVIAIPVVVNAALAGSVAGYQCTRQPIYDAEQVLVEPADFLVPVEAASNWSIEEQATLYVAPLPSAVPTYLSNLASAGASVVPASSTEANAAQSIPVAMAVLAASIFDGRTIPLNAAGNPENAGFFAPLANSVAAMFQNAVGVMQTF